MSTETQQTSPYASEPVARVTSMHVEDLPIVDRLERLSFASPWSQQMYLRELTGNPFSFYKVVRPTSVGAMLDLPPILAYGGCWAMEEEAHVMTVASHPDYRRCRLGEWLVLALIGDAIQRAAAAVTLEVRVGNQVAIKLYEKLGFVHTGLRKGYYPATLEHPREDALIMTLAGLDEVAVQQWLFSRYSSTAEHVQNVLWCRADAHR